MMSLMNTTTTPYDVNVTDINPMVYGNLSVFNGTTNITSIDMWNPDNSSYIHVDNETVIDTRHKPGTCIYSTGKVIVRSRKCHVKVKVKVMSINSIGVC